MNLVSGTTLAVARREIERDTVTGSWHLYTRPVIDTAAHLLADLYATGNQYAISRDAWSAVTSLPDACLSVVSQRIRQARTGIQPQTAQALLDRVAAVLHARGIESNREGYRLGIARTPTMPPLGTNGRAGLALNLTRGDGWDIVADQPGGGPACAIIATFDEPGATAVAELLTEYLAGHLTTNPFR